MIHNRKSAWPKHRVLFFFDVTCYTALAAIYFEYRILAENPWIVGVIYLGFAAIRLCSAPEKEKSAPKE